MIIFPAIDLMDGQVVRLEQGQADRKTVYSDDPVAFARQWQEEGAEWLHLVDLDAAFTGEPKNLEVVRNITEAIDIPCELGGGMRSPMNLEMAFEAGVSRGIIGSRACECMQFIEDAVDRFGADKIGVGIDAREGKVAIKGWVEESGWDAYDLAKAVLDCGVGTLVYTDISTDGMFTGPNLEAQKKMLQLLDGRARLIASGGIGAVDHLKALQALKGIHGAIVGKALYDGKLTLEQCLSITR
jgi:phosphoribosylformimino-5-aminoimidazole carboxamide ribotide isomerase